MNLLNRVIRIILAVILTTLFGFNIIAQEDSQSEQNDFFKQNVAFADARVRSISETHYVREVVLIAFSDSKELSLSITYDGTSFFDNGINNDEIANDGVYTSRAQFSHNSRVPLRDLYKSRSVMKDVIVDQNFRHQQNLQVLLKQEHFKPRGMGDNKQSSNSVSSLSCVIEFGTCGCLADSWGICDCCCITIGGGGAGCGGGGGGVGSW